MNWNLDIAIVIAFLLANIFSATQREKWALDCREKNLGFKVFEESKNRL